MTNVGFSNPGPGRSRKNLPGFSPGFTLIETLVAIMVLATLLTIILQLFSGGLKASRLSGSYIRAIHHARAKMEEVLIPSALAEGVLSGEIDGSYFWHAKIDYLEPPEEELRKRPVDLFMVTVDVRWKEGHRDKHFEISTLTIAKKITE